MQLKAGAVPTITDDFHHDLLDTCDIKPGDFLEPADAERVDDAINTIAQFRALLVESEYLEEY